MRTNVYVDAFNLYYGCLKRTPYRWLDLAMLCSLLLPNHSIHRIRYFTALVSARPGDPRGPQRQQVYLRALRTIPNLTLHYGCYLTHPARLRRQNLSGDAGSPVWVLRTEEKGSDVNLATYLLVDAFRDDCEAAVVVSNDSDLVEPIRIVRAELGKIVGLLNPQKRPSRVLVREATFIKQVRPGVLAASQFPPILVDARGSFHKPPSW